MPCSKLSKKKDFLTKSVAQASLEAETNHPEWLVSLLKKTGIIGDTSFMQTIKKVQ